MGKAILKYAALLIAIAAVVLGILLLFSRGLIPGLQPTTTINATIIRDSVQRLSTLVTTRMNYSSVITSEVDMPEFLRLLYGQRQVLVATGHVTAGIDLTQLQTTDITLSDGAITLRLPPPELLDCFLDEGATYVAAQDTGIFARDLPTMDQDSRRYAVEQFRQQALEGGILAMAQEQAASVIEEFVGLFTGQGVRSITVIHTTPPIEPILPPTCV
jgi:hypothetical protein